MTISLPPPPPPPGGDSGRGNNRTLITIGIATAFVVLIGIIAVVAMILSGSDQERDESGPTPAGPSETSVSSGVPQNATADFGVVHDANATGEKSATDPVEVIVYEDFQCPACRMFEEQSGAFLDAAVRSGDITVEYRPISFLDQASGNAYSSRAANAALCVLDEGGAAAFKSMHDLLFANQPDEGTDGPEDSELIATARQAGVGDIDDCIITKAYAAWLNDAMDSARDNGLSGTPYVVVAGQALEGQISDALTPDGLRAAIDAAR